MRRIAYSLLMIAMMPLSAAYPQPQPPQPPPLAGAIADGMPFVIQLRPGEDHGTLIGGATYFGQYNRDSHTFTVSGPGRRDDGVVIPVTATYGGADPLAQQLSVWGALYEFDGRGNLYLYQLGGRLAGRVSLRR